MWDLSFPTRDQTCDPVQWKQILNHWATREVPYLAFLMIRIASKCSRWYQK